MTAVTYFIELEHIMGCVYCDYPYGYMQAVEQLEILKKRFLASVEEYHDNEYMRLVEICDMEIAKLKSNNLQ